MKKCDWEEIEKFRSKIEFESFLAWMENQIASGIAEAMPVEQPFSTIDWQEKWFRHKSSGQKWRLVWPDPPFPGTFEPVSSDGPIDSSRR